MEKRYITSREIVNNTLKYSGQEAIVDYKLRDLLILIVEASLRQGYVQGYEDSKHGLEPKITYEKLMDFKKLYKERGL